MTIDEKQYINIITILTELQADVKGIHRRQDITNGRMAKNEEKMIELDRTQGTLVERVDGILKSEQEREKAAKEKAATDGDNRKFWNRIIIERFLWVAFAVAIGLLTKFGVINLAIWNLH